MENSAPGHALPKSTVIGTYIGLLILAFLMIAISRVPTNRISIDWLDVHAIKTTVIMLTALMMGSIIALFLMGLRYDHKLLNATIFISNFAFLLIFVVFTWADTSFRGEVDPSFTNQKVGFESPVEKAEKAEQAVEGAKKAAEKTEAPATPAAAH